MSATSTRLFDLRSSDPNSSALQQAKFPLTELQRGMLFHSLENLEGVDVEQLVIRTPDPLDPIPLGAALDRLIATHPILRTRFEWDDGTEPCQVVEDDCSVELSTRDRTRVAEGEKEQGFMVELTRDRARGVDLSLAPMFRATLFRYAGEDHRLLLTMHHAVIDGRSFPIILEDLFKFYEAALTGHLTERSPARMEFRDFVEWSERQDFETESRTFWTEKLKGFTAPTPLVIDNLSAAPDHELSWQEEISLSESETTDLETLASSTEVTMNTIVQGAWSILLAKYSSESDIVFGGTRACRKSSLPDVEDAVGLFINTLPVRAEVEPEKTLRFLLGELREQWVAMREHEHTPLGKIQSWSDLEPGQSLFESILVFEKFDLDEAMKSMGGAWTERDVELYEKTNFPITVAAYHGTRLRIKIEFDRSRFDRDTIQRMLGHLGELLRQFPIDPEATVESLHLTTEAESIELRDLWANPVEMPAPDTIVRWFEDQVAKSPEGIALTFEGQSWTYEELNSEGNRVAHFLSQKHGVERGQIIGLCVDRSPEIVFGILGILKAGAAYLPIDLAYPNERLQWMLEDSRAPVLLTQRHLEASLPQSKAAIVPLETTSAEPTGNLSINVEPSDIAYVIFTSGSTGKPKGCRVTHRNVTRLMGATEPWFQFDEKDVWTLFHSFAFDFSVWEIWGALLYGGRLVVVPYDTTRSPETFHELLVSEKVTVLNQTPSAFRQLIEVDRDRPADALALRTVIFGGEALELESLRPWFDRHGDTSPQLVNMYGITETTVHVTYRPISRDDLTRGSVIGKPIPDLEIHLFDPMMHPVPISVPGEIYVGGAGVADGYLNRPELTAERFISHPSRPGEKLYRTGDLARFLPEGDLEYLGRCDDQVKIRGFRIELGEIQSVLVRHPEVREAFVTVADSGTEKKIVAYLVGDRSKLDVAALRAHAGNAIPPYMIPSAFVLLDRFPLTNNGKIDRKALPQPEAERRAGRSEQFAAPKGDTETELAEIWARVLRLDRVGRDENYFQLGGDSILSIQIVSQARKAGYEMTPRQLFDHQTIAELAAVTGRSLSSSSVELIPREGPAPLTPIQRWFFGAHDLPNPNHWNQAFVFTTPTALDPDRLEGAFSALVGHHPALRTRYDRSSQTIRTTGDVKFSIEDEFSEDRCLLAQQSLDLAVGPLLSAVYFPKSDRLFIAIHHLAVDGVSWRILLEDLESFYNQTKITPATTPFVNHAHRLATCDHSDERTYWEDADRPFLLTEAPAQPTRVEEVETVTQSLSVEQTEALLSRATSESRSRIAEILTASVIAAIARETGRRDIAIDLEGHGREEFSGIDFSRTVGWFTTIYPLALDVEGESDTLSVLACVKDALREVPADGNHFGLLDLDSDEPILRDVLFNYLGHFDQITSETKRFDLADEECGCWYDADATRSHRLEINAWVRGGRLEFRWSHAGLPSALVEGIASGCIGFLEEVLTSDCLERAWIAQDFPLSNLETADIQKLPGEVEDVLSLTPLQELYYTLEIARPGAGIDRWEWDLVGEVDRESLRRAWEYVVNLHPGLRTSFHGGGLSRPVQIVRPSIEVTLDSAESSSHQIAIDQAPLMQLALILDDEKSRFVWTHHHLQIDGSSWPVLLAQVSRAYRSFRRGETPQIAADRSIRDFLRWRQGADFAESRAFWRENLAGFEQPNRLSDSGRGAVFAESTVEIEVNTDSPINTRLQAAWSLVVARRSDATDVVFGASFSGRPPDIPDMETMVGTFVNNLPVRVAIDADETFAQLLTRQQIATIDLAEHQHLPLSEIQDLSTVPLRSRLFDSLLVFQNYVIDDEAMQWDDLTIENFHAPVRTNFPLTLVVEQTGARSEGRAPVSLRVTLVYQTGLFDADDAGHLLEAFRTVLSASPEKKVGSILDSLALEQLPFAPPEPVARPTDIHPPVTKVQRRIARIWERAFGISGIGIDENFFDLGGNSLLLVRVHGMLTQEFGNNLSVVDVFGSPTIRKLAATIEAEAVPKSVPTTTAEIRPASRDRDIAIIGMSGRFPGAETIDEFWQNLSANIESILDFDDEELRRQGLDSEAMRAAGHYVQRRGQIPDPDCFDAAFFDMSPREASATDPQQRLFLETAWSTLEDAGYAPSTCRDRIGVFAGMSNNSFYEQYVRPDEDLRSQLGDLIVMMANEKDYLATRTAYKLDLDGPALNLYTACSTSLVAVAEAVHALREGRCEMALAGAVSLTFPQSRGYYYEEGGITSPDGHCRPFDASSEGTIFSNGMGAMLLKPLDQALADRDSIHAVIRGVGLNNDGADKVSFTAPSVAGQAGAIRAAQLDAGIEPDSIGYVEGHGTATALGDPIEVEALTRAFREGTEATQFCRLGSVKSNIGHLDAAAGMAGLIKTTLVLRESLIPATLHTRRANPKLAIETSPFRLVPKNETWDRSNGTPHRAAVSSFGVGGTNAHLVLEEAPPQSPVSESPRERELILLSAKSPKALVRKRADVAAFLRNHPETSIADLAWTLTIGREQFSHRVTFVAGSIDELIERLEDATIKVRHSNLRDLPIAFLFPGQGAQFAGMGQRFYDEEPVFRKAIDHCATVLEPTLGHDLREIIFDDAGERLKQTRFTQPALFSMSYALGRVLESYGIRPSTMLGHSVGEYGAACLAGVLSPDDALRLIAIRGQLVDELPGGTMLSIRLPEEEVRPLLTDGVEIAALNSPRMTVVAGDFAAVEQMEKILVDREIPHKRLRTSHAFHSAMMEAAIPPFRKEVTTVKVHPPQIPYVSNVTGDWVSETELNSPDYWASHVREAVRFSDGVRTLTADAATVLLEVGPGRSCVTFAKQTIEDSDSIPTVTMIEKESGSFLEVIGDLWAAGGDIDWSVYFGAEQRRRISLPTYPFERVRHWPASASTELVLPLQARDIATTKPIESTPVIELSAAIATTASRYEVLVGELTGQFSDLTGSADLDPDKSFLDLGLDSLLIGQAAVSLSRHFGTKITFRHLMSEHDSIAALARHLDHTLEKGAFAPIEAAPVTEVLSPESPMEERLRRIESAIEQIRPGAIKRGVASSPEVAKPGYAAGNLHSDSGAPVSFGPFRPVETAPDQTLTTQQRIHLDRLIEDYTRFSAKSREHIQKHRARLADPRVAAGFNPLWKEMVYPVVTSRSEGAYLWDLDDNRWIDVTHGFGLGLFGHRPDFVVKAVAEQLATGFEIGPSSPLAGEVAEMLCEFSGKDRVSFCNTGSEAVTAAIRIARTVSHRDKIAVFQGSYHGIFDEVLGRPLVKNGELVTAPIAPGITGSSLENVLILDYGNPESLKFIARHANDLAAVLVEPVQSRKPALQPREFLHELRRVTAANDIALVFDEVVTGFRPHPRGAQGVFDIDADLVTYGKVLGGGMPIGALAGRKKYMDALDGGAWSYGDESGPEASVTFFAGTFVRHPLALAAARAILTEIREKGGDLQVGLDRRTDAMVQRMNGFCEARGVPIKLTRFSSMYFIHTAPDLKHASLLFYHMRLRGIHIWETRPSFLSLAHSGEDVESIVNAFAESICALQDGGFFPGGASGEISYPLTPQQEEVLLASAMGEEYSRAFNESISIVFEGGIDRTALLAAITAVVGRHESLRTTFDLEGGRQLVREVEDTKVVLGEGESDFSAPYDPENGPLFRFDLIGDDELRIGAHHSICDGWSFGVIYEDIVAHYRRKIGDGGELPPVTDFHKLGESSSDDREDTDFWISHLTPPPPALRLPTDRRSASSPRSGSVTRTLSAELGASLLSFGKSRRLTPYTMLFAAYRDVLARVSEQDDFCIGTPVASQAGSGLPGLVGHGVHFLPLRCRQSGGTSIDDYFSENRDLILDSLDHQNSTLSTISRKHPERLEAINATFTLETISPEHRVDGKTIRIKVNPKEFSNFDLSLFVTVEEGEFVMRADYRKSNFTAARVENWLRLIEAWIVAAISTETDTRLDDLKLTTGAEQGPDLRIETQDVISLFEAQVDRTPDAPALIASERRITYAELDQLADRVADKLNLSPGDRVVLEARRSPELITTILAILKAGGSYVPLDPDYPAARLTMMREDTDAAISLDEDGILALFEVLGPKTSRRVRTRTPDSLAYIMFTSGSTGRPKGVMIPDRGVTRLVREPDWLSITSDDVFLQAAPVSFDASTLEIWGPLLNGGTLVLPRPGTLTLDELGHEIREANVTVLWLTAGLFNLMVDEQLPALRGLKALLAGGDVLSTDHVRRAVEGLPSVKLINGYGPTENTTFTTCHTITKSDLKRPSIPIGNPVIGTSVVLLDGKQKEVPTGIAGELYTGGEGLSLGYCGDDLQTSEKFVNGHSLYRTGDRCRRLEDGSLEFLGRIDNQVKIRGFRIEPAEVESMIETHPEVRECRVVVAGSEAGDRHLEAFCRGREVDLTLWIRQNLATHLRPSSTSFIEAFPLGPNGKIDDAALLLKDRSSAPIKEALDYQTDTERSLHRIWSELLGRADFGADESFFQLGGHSLLGLRMFSRLQHEFGYSKPLATLFDHPTIRQLAANIDRETGRTTHSELDPHLARMRVGGVGSPLFLVHGGDGGIVFYRNLVEQFHDLECPVYAIESPSLMLPELPAPEFETIVERYLEMIRQANSDRACTIAGYSFGGIVAFEMARRLEERGVSVKLILLDAATPEAIENGRYSLTERAAVVWRNHRSEGVGEQARDTISRITSGARSKLHHRKRLSRCESDWIAGRLTDPEDRSFLLNELHSRSLEEFAPQSTNLSALLIKSTEVSDLCDLPPGYGWNTVIPDLKIKEVAGDHYTLFSPDQVGDVARAIETFLNRDSNSWDAQTPGTGIDAAEFERSLHPKVSIL